MTASTQQTVGRPASPPSAGVIGSGFVANAYGYKYEWLVISGVLDGPGGPFVWAKPVRRIPETPGKRGRLRSEHVWYLALIPNMPAQRPPATDV
jgi:hypothetical protein